MLRTARTLKNYKLECIDGELGKAKEFHFDTQCWIVRYLIAETGSWLAGRKILISPHAMDSIRREDQHIFIDLNKNQIKDAPLLYNNHPISREFEEENCRYYDWPIYWHSQSFGEQQPRLRNRNYDQWNECKHDNIVCDIRLRSTLEINDFHIQTLDNDIGHIEDFIIDDAAWVIRYLIVSIRSGWPEYRVLIPPQWINRISDTEGKVFVSFNRESFDQMQEYTEESLLNLNYETELCSNYNLSYDQFEKVDRRAEEHEY